VQGNSGITLTSPVNVAVSGNHVQNINGAALSVTCPSWPNCSGGGAVNIAANEFSAGPLNCCSSIVYLSGVSGSFTQNTMNPPEDYDIAVQMDNTGAGFKVASNNFNLANGAATQYGIYVHSDNVVITGNRVFNSGANVGAATGIYNVGASNPSTNKITKNEIRCFGTPTFQVTAPNVFLTCPWQ